MRLLSDNLKDKHIFAIGLAFVCTGLLMNEWLLAMFFSPDKNLNTIHRIQIRTFDMVLTVLGFALLLRKKLNFKILRWISLGLMSLSVLFLLFIFIWRIQFKYSIDYNEGWNAYYCNAAVSGEPIYDNKTEWTGVNYPPVSFYLVGFVGRIMGDQLLAGRCISVLSLLLIVIGTGCLVRKLKGDVFDAIFASVFCLGLFVADAPHYMGMDDPQLLANVIILGGLMLYLQNPSRLLLIAMLCSVGIFVKHTVIALPVAITIDLFFRSRKDFLKWTVYLLLVLAGLTLIIQVSTGGEFLQQLSADRRYSMEKLVYWLIRLGKWILIPLLVASPWLFHSLKRDVYRIIPVYLITSLFIGIVFSGGIGTDVNMFFDLFIILSVAAGLLFSYFRSTLQNINFKPHLVSFLLSVVLSVSLFSGFLQQCKNLETCFQSPLKEKAFLKDSNFLRSRSGPVLCENILLCYSAGKIFEYDPFFAREKLLLGEQDEGELLNLLEKGYFKTVQLDHKLPERYFKNMNYTTVKENGYFTENFMRALGSHYVLVRKNDGSNFFYEPKNFVH
jgi:hypothetical protein